jgi:hypothetical protein
MTHQYSSFSSGSRRDPNQTLAGNKKVQCPRGKGKGGKTDEASADCSRKISAFEGI